MRCDGEPTLKEAVCAIATVWILLSDGSLYVNTRQTNNSPEVLYLNWHLLPKPTNHKSNTAAALWIITT